ncbi:MAG: hypothetical protein HC886_17350 [Leptolyngbyaceae cyanobacterium SM1_1_3]|nr:hypothetical protein [Leptolyngbyaceae cyanobacterium SM1_1_3]
MWLPSLAAEAAEPVRQAQSPLAQPAQPLIAQSVTSQERQELERLQREANLAFSRATTLFVVLLGALVLLVGVGVAMLWFLRQSVVREVAAAVRTQLNEMTDLENQIRSATKELDQILHEAETLADELADRSEGFTQEATSQKQRSPNW